MRSLSSSSRIIDPKFLLTAYANGYFPMADSKTGEIGWYSPDPRAIFDLERFNIPRSLHTVVKNNIFEIRVDTRFEEVMRQCGARDETWISEDIVRSYLRLHALGFAHSVESWKEDQLVGGLYGVALRGAFFGESMFSRITNASKVALVHLVERMKRRGYELLDTQFNTPHLAMFGAEEISREEYLRRLQSAIQKKCSFIENTH
ncbi:MAG: leucyl/phenylalanyl-tRNA--protein transferase [Bacteroidota bacterium]